MKSSREIEEICRKYRIKNYTINEDGSIDVNGDVDLIDKKLIELPLNFNRVNGDFNCSHNYLTELKGCPKYVGNYFSCSYNYLTSLEYSPKYVKGSFNCDSNKITDLYGISDYIGNYLYCDGGAPIGIIINVPVDIDFVRAFNSYRVIKDGKVILKRLKYVMETFDMDYDLEKIKKHYEII